MNQDQIAKQVHEGRVIRSRGRGRQRKLCLDGIEETIKERGKTLKKQYSA